MSQNFPRPHIQASQLPTAVVAKWGAETLSEGFVPFPKKLLRCATKLFGDSSGMEELAALLAIADYLRPNMTRLPSVEYLAFIAGTSPKEFEHTLNTLRAKGYIDYIQGETGLMITTTGFQKKINQLTAPDSTGPP